MGPFQAIGSALKAFFTFCSMIDQFMQAGEKVATHTNDSVDHYIARTKLERFAEIRSVKEQLKIAEGEVV